jgi:hypothetical protein
MDIGFERRRAKMRTAIYTIAAAWQDLVQSTD